MGDSSLYDQNFYKYAYEGHDLLDNYSELELMHYRTALLRKSELQAEYIKKLCCGNKIKVVEFCSGNGRLLVSLAQKKILDFGLGIEVAESRVRFAEKWRQATGLNNVKNIKDDVLTCKDIPKEYFDMAVCITAAFQYFYPISQQAPTQVLAKAYDALKPGGCIVLEMYQLTEQRKQFYQLNGGCVKVWQELPSTDKFRFFLNDVTYWADKNMARSQKIFIGRDGTIDEGRYHVTTYYTAPQMAELLKKSGFSRMKITGGFDQSEYEEGVSEVMVITAVKPE